MDWWQTVDVLKVHYRQIISWWDELRKVLAQREPSLSHSSPTMVKGQKNQAKVRANNIKQAFIKIKKWNTLKSNSLSLVELPLTLRVQAPVTGFQVSPNSWEVRLGLKWTMAEGENGVTTQFRSRNHKYSALRGRTDLYQSMCLEFSYGDGKVLGTQLHSTRGSASTHCVPNLNLIKGIFTMLF